MALIGLRPAKETNVLGLAPVHYAVMNGAYDLYVQDDYSAAEANQRYYMAKWIRLPAGDYTIRFVADDVGYFYVDDKLVASGTSGGDFSTPAVATFTIEANGVYRWDAVYLNGPAGSPGYLAYELTTAGKIVEVSRAQDYVADVIPVPDSALGPKPQYNADARLSYPIFLPKPNWKGGVTERLEWLTDVLMSETGAEQRRKLRQTPRRSLEAGFIAHGEYRSFIDSYLTGVGMGLGLVPIWWDEVRVDGEMVAGSVDVFGDFALREFAPNEVVIIRREGLTDYELNIVAEKTDTKLTLAIGLQKDTAYSTITPVRVAQIREQLTGVQLSDQVRQYQLRFFLVGANYYQEKNTYPVYAKTELPIFTLPPDYRTQMDLTYDRNTFIWDNEVGQPYVADPGGSAFLGEKLSYQIFGREQMDDFKKNIYHWSGKWREFHMPSGHNEFVLTRDIGETSGALVVRRCGFTQFRLSAQPVHTDILVELYDGTLIPSTIISSRAVEDEEWLFLAETIPSVPKDQVRRISYMPRSRLDIDGVEITRLTDADGVSQVSLTTRALAERRSAPPIPIQ